MPPLPRDLGPATPVDLARTSEADLRAAARALPPGGHLLVTLGPGRARRDAARLRATGLVLMPEHPAPGIRVACRPLELGDAALDHAEALLVEALALHGSARLRARGGSMRPAIPDGSLVTLAAIPANRTPAPGRVLLVAQPGRTVLHRLRARVATPLGRAYLCRGDRVAHADLPVWRSALLGWVVAHEPR